MGAPVLFKIQAFSDFDSSTSDAKIPPCSINFAGVSYSATFPLSNTEKNHVTKFFQPRIAGPSDQAGPVCGPVQPSMVLT